MKGVETYESLYSSRLEQNTLLMSLLPQYLEQTAIELQEVEPRLADPKKRAKWTSKITNKVLERLPMPTGNLDQDLALTAREQVNAIKVGLAITRVNALEDVSAVLMALEACEGSSWAAEHPDGGETKEGLVSRLSRASQQHYKNAIHQGLAAGSSQTASARTAGTLRAA